MPKSVLDQILDELRARKARHAHAGLGKPPEKTEFGYGRACGYYQALDEFEGAIQDILNKEKERD